MNRFLATVLACVALAACASAGSDFKFSNARKFRVGMTETEVMQLMDKPTSVSSRSQDQIWIWSYAKAGLFSVDSKSLSVIFREGRVVEVPTIPDSF